VGNKDDYLKINEVEKMTGIPRSTIHFYLRKGLLHPPVKTGRTMAYYNSSHIERLRLIQQMKNDLGIPITYIKERLALHTPGSAPDLSPKPNTVTNEDFASAVGLKDRRKNEIISVAIKIFSEKGFYKTKVKDITDALDMSTGTFYIYFKNKEDLFNEAIDGVVKSILGGAAEAIKNEKDFMKRLLLRGQVFFEQYSKYSEVLNQLRAEMTRDSQEFQQKVKKIYHGLTQPIIKEFRAAMDQGLIRKTDPDLLAYAMTGLIETMSFRITVDPSYSFGDIMLFLSDFIINGVPLSNDPEEKQEAMAVVTEYIKGLAK
jgi:AcrR family transcriptional regulator/predicted DNA-binding transcriptional regulator AlpA